MKKKILFPIEYCSKSMLYLGCFDPQDGEVSQRRCSYERNVWSVFLSLWNILTCTTPPDEPTPVTEFDMSCHVALSYFFGNQLCSCAQFEGIHCISLSSQHLITFVSCYSVVFTLHILIVRLIYVFLHMYFCSKKVYVDEEAFYFYSNRYGTNKYAPIKAISEEKQNKNRRKRI